MQHNTVLPSTQDLTDVAEKQTIVQSLQSYYKICKAKWDHTNQYERNCNIPLRRGVSEEAPSGMSTFLQKSLLFIWPSSVKKNLYRDDCCQLLSCVNHTTPGLKAISQNGIGCCQNTWLSHLLYELVLTLSDLVRPKTVMLYVLAPKTYRNRLLGASGRKSPCAGAEWMPSAVCVPETLCLQIIVGRGVQIFSAPRWLSKTCNPRITHQHFIEVDQGT